MKKLMLSFAAVAAFVSVASAEDAAWFTGTIGSEAGGSWTMAPGDGSITTNSNPLALKLEDAAASFEATSKKSLSGSENLNFATSANFKYSYDTLPEVDSQAKAGVVVYTNEYYVLAKKESANDWAPTGIAVGTIDANVNVSVTISNGNSAVYAIYNIAGTSITKEVVAGDSAWGMVDYKGSGEVASLVGTTTSLSSGWMTPGGYAIEVDPSWAEANNIDQTAFASDAKLSNGFSASESYILGLNTNEAFKATLGLSGDKESVVVGVMTEAKVADKVSYNVWVDGVLAQEDATLPYVLCGRGAVGSNEKTIEVRPDVAEQSTTGKSQTIGIWVTPQYSENTSGYIVIPYECEVAHALFNLANENHDDFMYVYDAESGEWDTWKVNARSTTWEFVPTLDRTEPIVTVLHPGQAVKVSIGKCGFGPAKTFWFSGDKVDRSKTTVVPGKYNLIGDPDRRIVPLAKFAAADKIRTFDPNQSSVLPDVSYAKYGDQWYRIPLNGEGAVATDIESGVNGFFLYTSGTEIDWSPAAE